jgi:hypothetical protein
MAAARRSDLIAIVGAGKECDAGDLRDQVYAKLMKGKQTG